LHYKLSTPGTIFFVGPTFNIIFTNVALAESVSIVEAVASMFSFTGAAQAVKPSNPVGDLANDANYVELRFLEELVHFSAQ
jgi:membrane-associated protease RseP (regulator of RpoE activity)